MSIDVIMPKLGESITEGTILEWKKKIGDDIAKDETLLEIATDKVDSEIPSPGSGKIIEILFRVNDVVPVGEVIARIGTKKDDVIDKKPKINKNSDNEDKKPDNEINESKSKNKQINIKKDTPNKSNKFYSPLVKSIAKKENISIEKLDAIEGSGLNGRVNKKDVLNFIKSSRVKVEENDSLDNIIPNDSRHVLENKIEPMGYVRKIISKHMINSRNTSVHVYSTSEVDMTQIVKFRNNKKEIFNQKYQCPLTFTPFIIDAVIRSIHEFPLLNACVDGENIQYNQNINIGIAVALPDDNLIVPVIKKTEELNFLGITRSTNDLASRARSGKLNPDEGEGSTFTVTNPGVFGSLFGMGIINQPNVGLLSVGAIHKKAVVKETEYGDVIVSRSMMYLTLAYDHRIVDGAYGTKFLSKIKYYLENCSFESIKI